MLAAVLVLALLPEAGAELPLDGVFDLTAARGLHLCPGAARDLSKKETVLLEKAGRSDVHLKDADLGGATKAVAADRQRDRRRRPVTIDEQELAAQAARPGTRLLPITTLFNLWTHEALPVFLGDSIDSRFHRFLRDHYTNQATQMDTRLVDVLKSVARNFNALRVDVVSGYRSAKYNLMLRKKGHQVARSSAHVDGRAVDFRVRGVPTKVLLQYVRSLRQGGVGFYPHSQFVHSDTGRIRYWNGS